MACKNRRLLFFAHYFPPCPLIASIRTGAIARELARNGWDVVVVTPKLDISNSNENTSNRDQNSLPFHVIEVESFFKILLPEIFGAKGNYSRMCGRILRRFCRLFSIEYEFGWAFNASRAALGMGKFDLVLSSGGPWSSHSMAMHVANKLSCPYVLDYRDLWLGNPHVGWKNHKEREAKIYHDAAGVVVVSDSMREYQIEAFGEHRRHEVISNGFSLEHFADIKPIFYERPSIVYAGQFYPPISGVVGLYKAFRKYGELTGDIDFQFHYYGPSSDYVETQARLYGLESVVQCHGLVDAKRAKSALLGANLAVVVISEATNASIAEAGIVTGKIYEIIALGVPALIIAPLNSDIREMVEECKHIEVFCGEQTLEIVKFIKYSMNIPMMRSEPIEEYNWRNLGMRYSKFLIDSIS